MGLAEPCPPREVSDEETESQEGYVTGQGPTGGACSGCEDEVDTTLSRVRGTRGEHKHVEDS